MPSGVWARDEYERLRDYDNETCNQPTELFACHQADGHLCAGWVAAHRRDALALRMNYAIVHPSVYSYETEVPVFASGNEAADHGIRDISRPGAAAVEMANKLAGTGAIREWG